MKTKNKIRIIVLVVFLMLLSMPFLISISFKVVIDKKLAELKKNGEPTTIKDITPAPLPPKITPQLSIKRFLS